MKPTLVSVLGIIVLVMGLSASSSFAADSVNTQATITISPGGYNIVVAGNVTLADAILQGVDQTVSGTASPTFTVYDGSGKNLGWHIVFNASDFRDGGGSGGVIPAAGFRFNATGGTIVRNGDGGQDPDPAGGPRETSSIGALSGAGLKVVTAAATFGKGRYDYTPLAANFTLVIPAQTVIVDGNFASTLTATVPSGP